MDSKLIGTENNIVFYEDENSISFDMIFNFDEK